MLSLYRNGFLFFCTEIRVAILTDISWMFLSMFGSLSCYICIIYWDNSFLELFDVKLKAHVTLIAIRVLRTLHRSIILFVSLSRPHKNHMALWVRVVMEKRSNLRIDGKTWKGMINGDVRECGKLEDLYLGRFFKCQRYQYHDITSHHTGLLGMRVVWHVMGVKTRAKYWNYVKLLYFSR